MRRLVPLVLPAWLLPLVVLALVLPSITAFALVGPQLGLPVGALTVAVVLVLAGRARYDEEIEVARAPDGRYRLLIAAGRPLDEATVVEEIAAIASAGEAAAPGIGPAELLVIAPARTSRLDRLASDLEPARRVAERALAVSTATLGEVGLAASARVGDADTVQAIEDALREFAAHEVVLVGGPGLGAGEVEEVRRRLDRPVWALGVHVNGSISDA